MKRLEDLAPLVGTALAGALDLDIATENNDAGKVKIALRGDKLRSGEIGVGSVQLDATVTDPFGAAAADATMKAERLSGVADISRANATLKGNLQAFDVTLAASGAITNANLAVKIEPKPVVPLYFGNTAALKAFLKEAGEESLKPQDKLTIKKKDLEGKEADVVVLEPAA